MLGNFGSLRLTVSINSDGSVEQIVVDKSSGSKELDEAAKNIVMLSAPFAEFSSKMRNEVDVVNISRTWKFTKTNQLLTN
jgi:protein TonB